MVLPKGRYRADLKPSTIRRRYCGQALAPSRITERFARVITQGLPECIASGIRSVAQLREEDDVADRG